MPDRGAWHGRPPWWPEGEDWPGRGRRPRFLAFALIVITVFVGLGFVMGSAFHRPWFLWPFGVVAFLLVARFGRPSFFPVGKLVDATARLSNGDYSARVPEAESGPMRQVVRSFNGMAERLEKSSEQRRRLLADVGHELRTPLTVIQGELEAMADGVHPASPEQIEMLLDETRLLARLIDDLRVLSLSEAGELKLEIELIEAGSLVADAIAPYQALAARSNITLTATADPGSLPADPMRLHEVLANIIANAIRHTPAGGAVTLTAASSATGWLFSVRDTGTGIPTGDLPLIFERFVKGVDSRGTGLGLSIARELVRAHDGEMTASSIVGQGTIIEFSIPQARIPPTRIH
jgi:two-component system sensor histidine kinase BaeS